MYVSKKLVYLQMQKTGSTHVTRVLKHRTKGSQRERHEQLQDYQKFTDRLIVSSVRNPWDWYVSLWAYGCSGKGGVYRYLLLTPWSEIRQSRRNGGLASAARSTLRAVSQVGRRPDWKDLYADVANEENYRTWLKLVLGEEGRHIQKEGYGASPVKDVVGFMTYRFLALTTAFDKWNETGRQARSYDDILRFAGEHTIAKRILRMESLNTDIHALLNSIGIDISMDTLEAIGKTNASRHLKYDSYYDEETFDLVARRDRFIIDQHGYSMF